MHGNAGDRRLAARMSFLVALSLLGGWSWLKTPDPQIERGNDRYEAKDYLGAVAAYEAAGQEGAAHIAQFDAGTALLALAEQRQGPEREALLSRAEEALRRAASAPSASLRSRAYYNLGNASFLRERWSDAVAAYKKALRADPLNDDARYNLELAQRKHRDEQAQQQGQQGQAQQQGQQDRQDSGGDGPAQPPDDASDGDAEPSGQKSGSPPPSGSSNEPRSADPSQPPSPSAADRSSSGQRGQNSAGEPQEPPAEPDEAPPSELDRKLDYLERMSRELRRERFHGGGQGRSRQGNDVQDW